MSSSLNSSNARSTRRIFHCLGQSPATVMSPSGGTSERSGTISITSPRLQNEAGKRGQTIRTLIAAPSGGKNPLSFGSRPLDKPLSRDLLFDFKNGHDCIPSRLFATYHRQRKTLLTALQVFIGVGISKIG